MDEEDDDDQFFNSLHLIEEERSEHSDMLISEKS